MLYTSVELMECVTKAFTVFCDFTNPLNKDWRYWHILAHKWENKLQYEIRGWSKEAFPYILIMKHLGISQKQHEIQPYKGFIVV